VAAAACAASNDVLLSALRASSFRQLSSVVIPERNEQLTLGVLRGRAFVRVLACDFFGAFHEQRLVHHRGRE
jgi:hypothetical protein